MQRLWKFFANYSNKTEMTLDNTLNSHEAMNDENNW